MAKLSLMVGLCLWAQYVLDGCETCARMIVSIVMVSVVACFKMYRHDGRLDRTHFVCSLDARKQRQDTESERKCANLQAPEEIVSNAV